MKHISKKQKFVNKRIDEIEQSFINYSFTRCTSFEALIKKKDMAKKFVSEFTEFIKKSNSDLDKRILTIVDNISKKGSSIWIFGGEIENRGEPLLSFLKELARKNFVPQINRIFMATDGGYFPLVNLLSANLETKESFFQLFNMLPKDCQNKLLRQEIRFIEGDKKYSCPLIGGTITVDS